MFADDNCICMNAGTIKPGDDIEIVGITKEPTKTTCTGVEMFRKSMDHGQAGDNVGLLLRGLKRDDIMRGQVIAAPGVVKTYKKFEVCIDREKDIERLLKSVLLFYLYAGFLRCTNCCMWFGFVVMILMDMKCRTGH